MATGVYMIFLISPQKHRLWVLVRTASRGGSNEYPQSIFRSEIRKISECFSEDFHVFGVKFSIYLNRRVFVMKIEYRSITQPWTRRHKQCYTLHSLGACVGGGFDLYNLVT